MGESRRLVVNADDFGLGSGVNRAILRAHEHGIVTSASLMVRGPAATQAVAASRAHPRLGIGLHLDLGEWAWRNEEWIQLYEVAALGDEAAVRAEVERQLDQFIRLVGREPSHIDSHQHVHRDEPLRSIATAMARKLGVPLRHFTAGIDYCGDFYGQTAEGAPLPDLISTDSLIALIATVPRGTTELACHPGEDMDDLDTMYRDERRIETEALCDPRVRAAVESRGIELVSFAELDGRSRASVP